MDLLASINKKAKAVVQMTLTTYDESLCKLIEPNVSTTKERFDALMEFKKAGIPTVVWLSPILPFINDTEENIRGLLKECRMAGVYGLLTFGSGVTLRDGDRQYFYQKLDEHFPGLKERYIKVYGNAYELPVPKEKELKKLVRQECEKAGIQWRTKELFAYMHRFEDRQAGEQLTLFDISGKNS